MYLSIHTRLGGESGFASLPEFYICFVSYSSPTIAAFITMYIGMGTYPGRWLGRTVGSAAFTGIDTRCSVKTTPAVFLPCLFFDG